jgi:hypothetical protein
MADLEEELVALVMLVLKEPDPWVKGMTDLLNLIALLQVEEEEQAALEVRQAIIQEELEVLDLLYRLLV